MVKRAEFADELPESVVGGLGGVVVAHDAELVEQVRHGAVGIAQAEQSGRISW